MKIKKKNNLQIEEYKYAVNHIINDKLYDVLCIEYGWYRIINELGEPALFPSIAFNIIDNTLPNNWIVQESTEEEYEHDDDAGNSIAYFGPKDFLISSCFFENYFDNCKTEVLVLFKYLLKKQEYKFLHCNLEQKPW